MENIIELLNYLEMLSLPRATIYVVIFIIIFAIVMDYVSTVTKSFFSVLKEFARSIGNIKIGGGSKRIS